MVSFAPLGHFLFAFIGGTADQRGINKLASLPRVCALCFILGANVCESTYRSEGIFALQPLLPYNNVYILLFLYSDRGEENISFEDAALILHNDLHYPKDKALTFVKRFDKNNDGRLSRAEFAQMKGRLEET